MLNRGNNPQKGVIMDRNDIDKIIERIKASPSRHFVKKIAPELDTLEAAVSLSIITWREIAMALGVNPASMARARRRAKELFDEWKRNGVFDRLNNPAGASNVSNVRRDNNGVERLQSGNNVLQSLQSAGNGVVDEAKMRLIEAFRKSKPF
jgi:hypothetical protein